MQRRYHSASFFAGDDMRVLLAPMEGVLDSLVRELLTEVNDYDLCITEFLRVVDQLLPVKSFYKLCPELHHQSRTPSGTRVRVQLLGQYPPLRLQHARAFRFLLPDEGLLNELSFKLSSCPESSLNDSAFGKFSK